MYVLQMCVAIREPYVVSYPGPTFWPREKSRAWVELVLHMLEKDNPLIICLHTLESISYG